MIEEISLIYKTIFEGKKLEIEPSLDKKLLWVFIERGVHIFIVG